MPRPKNAALHNFFEENDKSEIICNNGVCLGRVLNKHPANLERHLRKVHPELHSVYIDLKCGIKPKNVEVKKTKSSREGKKRNIELAIVELFTKNARPLAMAEDHAFKILVQPAFSALGLQVNSHSVRERIVTYSQQLKTEIKRDLRGKLLSLKIDSVTKDGLGLFGISVQYIESEMIVVKILAIRELKSCYTSEYLKSIILDVLKEFAIESHQILTISTDNGPDAPKAVADIELDPKAFDGRIECSDNLQETLVLKTIKSEFGPYTIANEHCGADILELSAHDVLVSPKIKENLEVCRAVIKNLKKYDIFKRNFYKQPILDSVATWSSTYNMLQRLVELQEIITSLSLDNSALEIASETWNFVKEFIDVFRPLYISTIKLQSQQCCFSEFYVIAMDIIIQLQNIPPTDMITLLTESLSMRKMTIFNSDLFSAAIFLDPRIKVCLNSDQVEKAKEQITTIHNRIVSLKESQSQLSLDDQQSTSNRLKLPKTFSEYLQNLDPVATNESNVLQINVETDLMTFDCQQRLPLNCNILEFWSSQKSSLTKVANVVLAIPTTRISKEKILAGLRYILADRHKRLNPFYVDHVLFVKANGVFDYDD